MKYDHPELIDRLAAEYVLGTLRGPARRRFESVMTQNSHIADAVTRWQNRLNPLADAVPEIEPPASVWTAIQRVTGPDNVVPFLPISTQPTRHRVMLWRNLALGASAVAALLAVYIGVRRPEMVDQAAAVAVLSDDSGHAAFVLTGARNSRRLALARVAGVQPEPGQAYQLWLLPKGGAAPRSLGVISNIRQATLTLSESDARAIASADGIAISIEPQGGSPTGLPTGPIPFKGAVIVD